MKCKTSVIIGLFAVCILALVMGGTIGMAQSPAGDISPQADLGTTIMYQGRLTETGAPAHGSYDLQFALYDQLAGGVQVGDTITRESVAVDNGIFMVALDFGDGVFNGRARFLEISVRRGPSTGAFTTLSPRHPLMPAPYALALPGMRTENAGNAPNVIGGSIENSVADGVWGATIGGGGRGDGFNTNQVSGQNGTVSGGLGNTASADVATVSGGKSNSASGSYASIGGGEGNEALWSYTTVGGGKGNLAGGEYATVGGGVLNQTQGTAATIPGGYDNHANGAYSFAAGRQAHASHQGAFVWADSTGAIIESDRDNQFLARASGGVIFSTANGAMLQLIPHDESPNLIAGYGANAVTDGVKGATIAGGGESGSLNSVTDHFSVVAGGANNRAGDNGGTTADAPYAAIGGGRGNRASGRGSAIAGGEYNTASARDATVAGGYDNTAAGQDAIVAGGRGNNATGEDAAIAGGFRNGASALYAAVGGGVLNNATGQAATVGGGNANTASAGNATVGGGNLCVASGDNSVVGGGHDNQASGAEATIPGGGGNRAEGDFSFAAGRQAMASHNGSFVWADSSMADFPSQTENDFSVRATGGVNFVTAIDESGTPTAGISLPAGGSSWGNPSDRRLKENFEPADGTDVLARLADVPISTWNYRAQDPSIRHIGPMAQDFYAAFGVGEDELHITTVDADGVALAAIQGLYHVVQEQETQIADLEERLAVLEQTAQRNARPAELPTWLLLGGVLVAGVFVGPYLRRGGRS